MRKPRGYDARGYDARGMPVAEVPEFPASNCRDCGRHGDDYMIKETVWREASGLSLNDPRPRGRLCFDCLEHRLRRRR
jgi:hypothetical protein